MPSIENDRYLLLSECIRNADCPENYPFCRSVKEAQGIQPFLDETATGKSKNRCFQCITDEQCLDPTNFCVQGLCQQCRQNQDCTGPNTVCYNTECIQCFGSQQSPESRLITSSNTCNGQSAACAEIGIFDNQCVQCTSPPTLSTSTCNSQVSSLCTSELLSSNPNGTIAQEQPVCLACAFNGNCFGPSSTCDGNTFTCRGCLSNANCSDVQPICNNDTSSCTQCTQSDTSACPDFAPYCSAKGTCVECVNSSQCSSSAPVCDLVSGSCVVCGTDTDCPSNTFCVDNKCRHCLTDSDCPSQTPICDLPNDKCVPCLVGALKRSYMQREGALF